MLATGSPVVHSKLAALAERSHGDLRRLPSVQSPRTEAGRLLQQETILKETKDGNSRDGGKWGDT